MTIILNGKDISNSILANIKDEITLYNSKPTLAVINIGNNNASQLYIQKKEQACNKVGIKCIKHLLNDNVSEKEIINLIKLLNNDNNINGILLQLPLPNHLHEEYILRHISYDKDVDGFHSQNMGELAMHNRNPTFIACTPLGCLHLLNSYKIEISGKHVVIIGNSNIVGLPLSLLLLKNKATVTICHKDTTNIISHTKLADIVISACGQPEMIKSHWIKQDCIIIDIGINYIEDKSKKNGMKLVGDVDYNNVKDKVYAITPVPGGIGPMTVAMLLSNTLLAFKLQNNS
jgi:methylenetetrahydrofolate dehydrogenase (NADP+)/methenyltetrahydrofolate cyclohydrolase/formyltetrahydrofolate synthetase